MDYKKRSTHRRTRYQEAMFYRKSWAEIQRKKKDESGGGGDQSLGSGGSFGGVRRENGFRIDSDSLTISDDVVELKSKPVIVSESVGGNNQEGVGCLNSERNVNSGMKNIIKSKTVSRRSEKSVQEDVLCLNFDEDDTSWRKLTRESEKGCSKMTEKGVQINGDYKKIQKMSKEGLQKKNVDPVGCSSKKGNELNKSLRKYGKSNRDSDTNVECSGSRSSRGKLNENGARIESCVDPESLADSDVVIMGDSNPRPGIGTVNFEKGQCSRRKKTGKSEKGFKMNEKGVEINGHSKKIQKKLNVGVKGKMQKKNKDMGPVADFDDDESDGDSDVKYLGETVASNVSSSKTGFEPWSGSKVWCENEENCDSRDESSGVKTNGVEKIGVSDEAGLNFRGLEKGNVDERDGAISVGSEDVEEPAAEYSEESGNPEVMGKSEYSSEEDNDDPDDEDYKGEKLSSADDRSSLSVDQEGEEEQNECADMKRKSFEENDKMVEAAKKRKREEEEEEEEEEDEEEEEEYGDDDVVEITSVNVNEKEKKVYAGGKEKVESCLVSGSDSCRLKENGNGHGIFEAGSADEEAKKGTGSAEGGLKRRRVGELDIFVFCNEGSDKEHKTLAERLRPRSVSKSRKKKQELGKFSCPLPVDEYEQIDSSSDDEKETDSSSSDDERDTDSSSSDDEKDTDSSSDDEKDTDSSSSDGDHKDTDCTRTICGKGKGDDEKDTDSSSSDGDHKDTDCTRTICGKGKGKVEKFTDKKKKKVGKFTDKKKKVGKFTDKKKKKVGKFTERKQRKDLDILQILADSIWQKGDALKEKLVSHEGKAPAAQQTLPLKFRFEDEDPAPPEKPKWQKEVDDLFREMEMALASLQIGPPDSHVVENDNTISTETETNPAARCLRGDHHAILDEEIGIRCRYCSLVLQEMKYVLPPFSKRSWDRRGNKHFGESERSILDDFPLQDSACQKHYGCKYPGRTEGTVWDLVPGIKESMYSHQREGFEFLWRKIAGGICIEKLGKDVSSGGSGCIISHAPGTGKTRLAIIFLQTFMKQYPQCRPMIIAPRSMLLTWEEEFKKWKIDIQFHNLNIEKLSGKENASALNFLSQFGNCGRSKDFNRMVKLYSWTKDASVLGISYTLFLKLTKGGEKKKQADQIRKILHQIPGLLVLDEGHTPRNDKSLIYKVLSKVETRRRIILSGTPFQNNFDELYNTFCMVQPEFAEVITSRSDGECCKKSGRKNNVARVKWASMTSSITNEKLEELKLMIEEFVHVHKGTILQENLPGLKDSLVFLQPTDLQKNLLEKVQRSGKCYMDLTYLVSLITVHPCLLPKRSFEEEDFSVQKVKLENLKLDPNAGVKTRFVLDLIRLSEAMKEKVLVFSQYIEPLTFIMEHLKSQFHWREGREILYMHGGLEVIQRQSYIGVFNDPTSEARVLLASIKACSEGINLVGASRVVLLDVVWNPSVDRQAISRAYRLGQKKVVYVYRLISGTMEGEKYARLAKKDYLSEMVFANKDKNNCNPAILSPVLQDKLLEEMVQHSNLSHMFEKILYQPKAYGLIDTFNLEDTVANTLQNSVTEAPKNT